MKGKDKLRFLATGDFHSDLKFVENIAKEVDLEKVDFVLFTGDMSEKKDDFSRLLRIFDGKKIFMVAGNHESSRSIKVLEEFYGVHFVGNNPVAFGNSLVLFGSNYVPIGVYSVFEEDIFLNLVENFNSVKDFDLKIMLHHLPPADTMLGDASPYPFITGSVGVKFFLENFSPQLAFCGHIHESGGLEEIVGNTKVLNVGRSFKVFDVDLKKKEIIFV